MHSALNRVAEYIKNRRKLLDMSQEMLAEKTGLSVSLIRRIERKSANPTLSSLERIAQVLETSIAELFKNDGQLDKEEERRNLLVMEIGQLSLEQLTLLAKFIKAMQK